MDNSQDFLPKARPASSLGGWHFSDDKFSGKYPALYALLATARVDDQDRVGATVTVFGDGGQLKFVFSDRHTDLSLFGSLDPAKGLWEQLEAFLRAHPDDWRPKRDSTASKRRY